MDSQIKAKTKIEIACDFYRERIKVDETQSADAIYEQFAATYGENYLRKAHFKQHLEKHGIVYINEPYRKPISEVKLQSSTLPVRNVTAQKQTIQRQVKQRQIIQRTAPKLTRAAQSMSFDSLMQEAQDVELEEENLIGVELTAEMFRPLKTNTVMDLLASKYGGFMKATVNFVTGESGAGKTTVCTNIATFLKQQNPEITIGFTSAEMDRDDWKLECFENPNLKNLNVRYVLDFFENEETFMQKLVNTLCKWDVNVVDSFEVICGQVMEITGLSAKKAEGFLLNLLRAIAAKHGIIFLVIQQFTKGGEYVGSTKIKHMPTSMFYVMIDEQGDRYIIGMKNRKKGITGKPLHFRLNEQTNIVEFDDERFNSKLEEGKYEKEMESSLKRSRENFAELLKNMGAKTMKGDAYEPESKAPIVEAVEPSEEALMADIERQNAEEEEMFSLESVN